MKSKTYVISFLCLLTAVFFVFRSIETTEIPTNTEAGEKISIDVADQATVECKPSAEAKPLCADDFKTITRRNQMQIDAERIRANVEPPAANPKTLISTDNELENLLSIENDNNAPLLVAANNKKTSEQKQPSGSDEPSAPSDDLTEVLDANMKMIDLAKAVKQENQRPVLQESPQYVQAPAAPRNVTNANVGPDPLSPNSEKRIRQHINYGLALARKGSTFAATSEFMQGLKLIAQYWDQRAGTTEYSKALERGFVALKEAEDFVVKESDAQHFVDSKSIIRSHRSKVLTVDECANLPTVEILRRYMKFAQTNLVDASGNSPIASELHYALGKLHLTLANFNKQSEVNKARSIVLFRTAFATNARNSFAANELAVILAQNGHWKVAKRLLTVSLRTSPTPVAWKNLANIHHKLNEHDLAQFAMNEYHRMLNAPGRQSSPVQWVSPQQFGQITPEIYHQQMANQTNANRQNRGQPHLGRGYQEPQKTANKPRLIDRVKNLFR